jgi:hypothetical protein
VIAIDFMDCLGCFVEGGVPIFDVSLKPLGMVIVFITQLPKQNSIMFFVFFDVLGIGFGIEIEVALLIIAYPNNDFDARFFNFIQNGNILNGTVNSDGIDACLYHQSKVSFQAAKIPFFLALGNRIVANPFDKIGRIVDPYLSP